MSELELGLGAPTQLNDHTRPVGVLEEDYRQHSTQSTAKADGNVSSFAAMKLSSKVCCSFCFKAT